MERIERGQLVVTQNWKVLFNTVTQLGEKAKRNPQLVRTAKYPTPST